MSVPPPGLSSISLAEQLSRCRVRLQALDIYPYEHCVGLALVRQYLPELRTLGMRPHAPDYFFSGLPLEHFPAFAQLQSLTLDSFSLVGADAQLPSGLTALDWHCREEKALPVFLDKLARLARLRRLTVGHGNFDEFAFVALLRAIRTQQMADLRHLAFKLCKFGLQACRQAFQDVGPLLDRLRSLRLELCYGDLPLLIELLLHLTGSVFFLLFLYL